MSGVIWIPIVRDLEQCLFHEVWRRKKVEFLIFIFGSFLAEKVRLGGRKVDFL
jgi:hypothetical protein